MKISSIHLKCNFRFWYTCVLYDHDMHIMPYHTRNFCMCMIPIWDLCVAYIYAIVYVYQSMCVCRSKCEWCLIFFFDILIHIFFFVSVFWYIEFVHRNKHQHVLKLVYTAFFFSLALVLKEVRTFKWYTWYPGSGLYLCASYLFHSTIHCRSKKKKSRLQYKQPIYYTLIFSVVLKIIKRKKNKFSNSRKKKLCFVAHSIKAIQYTREIEIHIFLEMH